MDEGASDQYKIFKAMERRIKERFSRRVEFLSHFIAFVLIMPAIWVVIKTWMPALAFWDIALIAITAGWTVGLLIHFVQVVAKELEDRAVASEMERLGLLQYEKFKRDGTVPERLVRLTDDGEIVELEYEDQEAHYG